MRNMKRLIDEELSQTKDRLRRLQQEQDQMEMTDSFSRTR
jgi:hypothetical protein